MSTSPRNFRRLATWTAVTAVAGLALAGSAIAAPTPPTVSFPENPTAADNAAVNVGGSVPDGPDPISYEISVGGGAFAPFTGTIPTPTAGTYTVTARAVQASGASNSSAPASLLVDKVPPTLTAATLVGPPVNGWYRSPATIRLECSDDNPITCADVPWDTNGPNLSRTITVTDAAGRESNTVTVGPVNIDGAAPSVAGPVGPTGAVGRQPTFAFRPASDAGSGVKEYRVQWQRDDTPNPNAWTTLRVVSDDGRVGDYEVPPIAYASDPLPEFVDLNWRVVVVDNVGNVREPTNTNVRSFLIDPTVPPAPVITGGPSQPTQNTSPTFTWEGTGVSFSWSVTEVGRTASVRSGAGTAKTATAQNLPDGQYIFHVTQYTAANRESEEATRSFVVDTTPPAAPTILTRPSFPSLGDAIFTWAAEPGAYSRWSVVDGAGNVVVPPTDTPVNQAKLPPLAENAYAFSVQQIDAAGNVSPATVEPFTVVAPLVAPSPSANIVTLLPKQNARRLQPKAGKTLFSRTPVLRWTRGPKGTKLFNLQIFRVAIGKNARTPKVTKILSVFPRGKAYRVPKSKTRPKTCYVWRVWPYTGREFTPKPLGVSNYCIASQKVLKKKAAILAQRKAVLIAKRKALRARR